MKKLLTLLVISWSAALPALSQEWFPFTQPWNDDSKTTIDASSLLVDYPGQDPAGVIDSRGHVEVSSDGHFIFSKTGKRARFWGVNFTFNASFPPCPDVPRANELGDPKSAEYVARRLAKLGVNVVRFHHMDYFASPNGIFDPEHFPNKTQHLDPDQLTRFDYLLYHLRNNGIYTNINLKVARHFGRGDGLEDTHLFTDSLAFFQGVSHYNPRMIELQQDYARQLLTHRNPYTGLTYAEDPAVLCVEIANEDSLFGNLLNDGGLNYLAGVQGTLPERYSRELDQLWNEWLGRRYPVDSALATAWEPSGPPVDDRDRARNGDFESGMVEWWVGALDDTTAQATAAVVSGAGPDGSAALRVQVQSDQTNWHVQGTQSNHSIERDHTYEIRFQARAALAGDITLDFMRGAEPWNNYGLSKTFRLATAWQVYSGRFRANATDLQHGRITFELGASTNTIWIDKVEFREVGLKGLEPGESAERQTVTRPVRSELGGFTEARIIDLFRFYSELDEDYFVGMRRYLKEEINLKSLVSGTAPWWAYLGDTAIQAKLDFVDGHYYWDHPWWSGVPAWSPTGWQISNRALVNQLADLSGLAAQAVEGKPFTVSEFNQPFPNQYAHEAPLLIALIGNLQDWDAIYMFDYAGSTAGYADSYIRPQAFFSVAGNPVKTSQMPVAARIFLARQSEPASERLNLELEAGELAIGYAKGRHHATGFLEDKGVDPASFLQKLMRVTRFDLPGPVNLAHPVPFGDVRSSNDELLWSRENQERKFLQFEGGGVQGVVGFLRGPYQFTDWSFTVTEGPEHLAVLLQSRDPVPLRESRRMILSVWTEEQNTGMTWNSTRTSLDNRWGSFPTIIRQATIDLSLNLPGSRELRVYPLDERGERKEQILPNAGSSTRYLLDTARDRTVWYEVVLREGARSGHPRRDRRFR